MNYQQSKYCYVCGNQWQGGFDHSVCAQIKAPHDRQQSQNYGRTVSEIRIEEKLDLIISILTKSKD